MGNCLNGKLLLVGSCLNGKLVLVGRGGSLVPPLDFSRDISETSLVGSRPGEISG